MLRNKGSGKLKAFLEKRKKKGQNTTKNKLVNVIIIVYGKKATDFCRDY